MSERFYLMKIQLLDIEPPIWRRFVVPASITLDRLHEFTIAGSLSSCKNMNYLVI
jgi:hypothetical protein